MSTNAIPPPRRNQRRGPSAIKRTSSSENGSAAAPANGAGSKPSSPNQAAGERTVKKLRLSKALTIPEGTSVSDACRRMAQRRVDAVLLTDSNGLLSGIVTDKDISTRVIAEGLRTEQTVISKIMTRNPIFVMADTLAIEALQKMVQGKFRHLPVVENGEVIAMLDITKCLYDAISRMEKAAEQGSALAAAVEGVERQWGSNYSAPYAFIETLRERMFKPSLSTIITENSKVAVVSPSDPVYVATKKMRDLRVNSVIIVTGGQPQGILTSKDVLMRVVAQNLSPELTLVEKVEGGQGAVNDMANTMMQKFWDSALALEPPDEEYDSRSELSGMVPSDADTAKSMYPPLLGNSFSFKFEDQKGRVHRFNSGTESLDELESAVKQRVGLEDSKEKIHLLYVDDEGDKVLLATDSDLAGAVNHAKLAGWKVLRLHIDNSDTKQSTTKLEEATKISSDLAVVEKSQLTPLTTGLMAGAVVLTGMGIMVYLKRANV